MHFCRHGPNFIKCWRDRGSSLIGAVNFSLVTTLMEGTGAVLRYNLYWYQKTVLVYEFFRICHVVEIFLRRHEGEKF
jgi:hypothetical protein